MDKERSPQVLGNEQKNEPELVLGASDTPTTGPSSVSGEIPQVTDEAPAETTGGEKEQPRHRPTGRGGPTANSNINSVKAGTAKFGNEVNNNNITNNYLLSPGLQETARKFSANDCWPITKAKEDEVARLFVANKPDVEAMMRILTEKRLLIISGEPETGKATAAIYLGKKLAEIDGTEIGQNISVIQSLGQHVRVDVRELCSNTEIFGERLVIFENALARKNPDILAFFTRVEHGIEDISVSLRKNRSFLIFTTPPSEIAEYRHALVENALCHSLNELDPPLLRRGLDERLRFLGERLNVAQERIEVLRAASDEVCNEFKTMPQIVRFVEYYVRNLDENPPLPLTEAMHRFKDISYWFLKDLAQDFKAWCFALSLCLLQSVNGVRVTPWLAVVHLWRWVQQHLQEELNEVSKPGKAEVIRQEEQIISPALTDDLFFVEKCRAEIVRDPNTLTDSVCFRNPSYQDALWQILLGHHRHFLILLIPHLCRMAEEAAVSEDSHDRTLAPQIIGRVGEIDPGHITFATINRWIKTSEKRLRASVAHLYAGILSSKDERYRSLCLRKLESFAESVSNPEDEKDRLLTAIATYAQVGAFDLPGAMDGLRQIATRHLEPALHDVNRIRRLRDRIEKEFDNPLTLDEALSLLFTHDFLQELDSEISLDEEAIFWGVQLAVTSLCHTGNPVHVFQELRSWATSSQTMGVLVALMFLRDEGIASQLEETRVPASKHEVAPIETAPKTDTSSKTKDEDSRPKGSVRQADKGHTDEQRKPWSEELLYRNPIILSLANGKKTVGEMARFLGAVYESFSTQFILPTKLQQYLQLSFGQHLKTWVRGALPFENCRTAMEDLFVELLRIQSGKLYGPIYQLLNDKDFKRVEDGLKSFADAVLKKYSSPKPRKKDQPALEFDGARPM